MFSATSVINIPSERKMKRQQWTSTHKERFKIAICSMFCLLVHGFLISLLVWLFCFYYHAQTCSFLPFLLGYAKLQQKALLFLKCYRKCRWPCSIVWPDLRLYHACFADECPNVNARRPSYTPIINFKQHCIPRMGNDRCTKVLVSWSCYSGFLSGGHARQTEKMAWPCVFLIFLQLLKQRKTLAVGRRCR